MVIKCYFLLKFTSILQAKMFYQLTCIKSWSGLVLATYSATVVFVCHDESIIAFKTQCGIQSEHFVESVNKQESIQYLTPSVSRHQRERRIHLKQRHHNTTSRKPKGKFLSQNNWPNGYPKKNLIRPYMQRYSMTDIVRHNRSTALERSIKTITGGQRVGMDGVGWFNRFYMATTIDLSSAVVYIMISPRDGFLTHQCNSSENIKIKRLQRWNNDEDSTARNK